MWPSALLIPLTHCLAPLSNTEEHVPCSLQRHTVNILSLYPWLCCRDLLLYTLISLLNHKSFCKALERSKKTLLCLKQEQILSRAVMPHTYAARSSHKPAQLEFQINTGPSQKGPVAACLSGTDVLRGCPFTQGCQRWELQTLHPQPPG